METIQRYHAHPEESAAEESWDYVQFQVGEPPPTRTCIPPCRSGTLTALSPVPGRLRPDQAGAPSSRTLRVTLSIHPTSCVAPSPDGNSTDSCVVVSPSSQTLERLWFLP